MVFKDLKHLTEAYECVVSEAKKTKKPDKDGDGIPDWADKEHNKPSKKENEKVSSKKKPAFMEEESLNFKKLCNQILSEKEYSMKGAFHDESGSNPQLDKDREKLNKLRAKRKKEAEKKKSK